MASAISPPKAAYVIVTPARNEGSHIEETIVSVVRQTITPVEWVIVDDGSTDSTSRVIEQYADQYPWIRPLYLSNRGYRDADIGAVSAFLEGYRTLKTAEWDFLVNLDADITFGPTYFTDCFEEFRKRPALGIGGGTLYTPVGSTGTRMESSPAFHVRGATKIYRRAYWDAVGGLANVPGWDTLDEIKAHLAGWQVMSFRQVSANHRRPTGQVGGIWRDAKKNGRADYFLAYHPLFMVMKCFLRLWRQPFLLDGLGHFVGFTGGYLRRQPQISDKAVVMFVRRQQLRRLVFLDTIWR